MTLKDWNIPHGWFEEIINSIGECVVIIDREGMVRHLNNAYCKFLETTKEEAVGKPVQNVIENTRMHMVLKTGQAELSAIQSIKGNEMVANRYPIYLDGEIAGAVGTVKFRNRQEWVEYARKIQSLLEELNYYKTTLEGALESKYSFEDLIGQSKPFLEAKQLAERVAGSQSSVLLLGESGTGKELFAHAMHQRSSRGPFPFVRVNCASIPEHLLESELFGYEEGAFTGAKRGGKKGKFQLAHRGTIFLDEIGDMPLAMQNKLLRVLQEKEIERVGGQAPIPIDVRVIAATHRNLEKMVQEGTFRQDLYYRLNVIKIDIPPLRERKDDIVRIAQFLLKKLERNFNRHGIQLSEEVVKRLQYHNWPGNIRELENVLERAVNVLDQAEIHVTHLPLYLRDDEKQMMHSNESKEEATSTLQPLKETIMAAEKEAIMQALKAAEGNKLAAARLLDISKTSFYDKCKLYNV
ncbi:sigma-54 interaction domain-containing protein [Metabacillus iocasae]|uniref:Transcriptional regulator with PAS, ATPase and Fis domain n=1 Tax=Priestia iocasae TaxID=2291674 RepID=A0ABS2QTD3_9BACI|nr:sigma 54-interacting transcriptional regulator [Metabacillus iocasae]MBM7702453.1 transcriptional regulator with PAS, ATPase and Fis domain [Metabacillus iocasae]